MEKKITITVEPVAGSFNLFVIILNGKAVKITEGSKAEYAGDLPEGDITIRTRASGMGQAKYKVTIDLPGEDRDVTANHKLDRGYDEQEFKIKNS
ncbi:MAG: hypothetical protein RLQ12_21895 [Cyclobacteriaceae bacterium]